MFDFTLAAKGVYVQFVKELVKEEWFLDEVRKGADVILLVGHTPVSDDNYLSKCMLTRKGRLLGQSGRLSTKLFERSYLMCQCMFPFFISNAVSKICTKD